MKLLVPSILQFHLWKNAWHHRCYPTDNLTIQDLKALDGQEPASFQTVLENTVLHLKRNICYIILGGGQKPWIFLRISETPKSVGSTLDLFRTHVDPSKLSGSSDLSASVSAPSTSGSCGNDRTVDGSEIRRSPVEVGSGNPIIYKV